METGDTLLTSTILGQLKQTPPDSLSVDENLLLVTEKVLMYIRHPYHLLLSTSVNSFERNILHGKIH